MNTQFKAVLVALAITGLGFSPAVQAGDATCEDIDWNPQILERFKGIEQACREVVVRDGKTYARFEVSLISAEKDGNVLVYMRMRDGSRVEGSFYAPADFRVTSSSGRTTFQVNQLSKGEILDVLIPASRITDASLGQGPA